MFFYCYWRWRFQPVLGFWGHLGLDFTLEDPADPRRPFLLRHVDYGLPGDLSQSGYRWSIARHSAHVSLRGLQWPPLRTPHGLVFSATKFVRAPREVGVFLRQRVPAFWGECGAYRTLGPNSNTGLRRTIGMCERETGYRFARPPLWMRMRACGWNWRGRLAPHCGPCAGYFNGECVAQGQGRAVV